MGIQEPAKRIRMNCDSRPTSSVGASGISLGSTVPQQETQESHFIQTLTELENQVGVRQAEIDQLKQKLIYLEADILIKQEALAKISIIEEENRLLRGVALEREKWKEQANELSRENERLRQLTEDLTLETRGQRQVLHEQEDKMKFLAMMFDLKDMELRQERENTRQLRRKLKMLSSPEETPERHGRFKRQSLKDCPRCHAEISTTTLCRYHPKNPVKLNGKFFFPCCQKSGEREPEGCHHDVQHTVVFDT